MSFGLYNLFQCSFNMALLGYAKINYIYMSYFIIFWSFIAQNIICCHFTVHSYEMFNLLGYLFNQPLISLPIKVRKQLYVNNSKWECSFSFYAITVSGFNMQQLFSVAFPALSHACLTAYSARCCSLICKKI